MAWQLRCSVRHDGASGAFLHESDAVAALGSSEMLRVVSDRFTSQAVFDRPKGIGRGLAIEQHYQVTTAGPLINRLMADYHADRRR